MRLITFLIVAVRFTVNVKAQKFRQEQFPFSPHFQPHGSGMFPSDSSLYLPPESHTPIPYFSIKNMNNLQFPYLPPTGTKVPSIYPTPFPFLMSSSMIPNFDDDDEEVGTVRVSTPQPSTQQKQNNTEKSHNNPPKEKREMRTFPQPVHQQAIDRIDIKFPSLPRPIPVPAPSSTSTPANQTPAIRRMVIGPEQRNDLGIDHIKAGSFQSNQFIPAPAGVFLSSTTEPAIPIIRLSNEMDLDGSFSYEALGADQTHYVQHSRMENMGPDKQEQVVEGSYSYVGDNGQTYTVHYIADSNGFRASGDHLPVAPPIPEIIQRSIQYNLAEEAKRPPNEKSWQEEENNNLLKDSARNNQFVAPPRLFTGRTPEAFSYSYSQGANNQNQNNNLVTAASSQVPVKTVDIKAEETQNRPNNNGPISPQITFLASQGAHLPSISNIQNSISRMLPAEKPSGLPQLMNYEAAYKEADQENNKALWRWQYGQIANNMNQNSNKETISRSFGEGDDIMINFSDMTPEQYTKVIRSQFEMPNENFNREQFTQNKQVHNTQNNYYINQDEELKKAYFEQNNNYKKYNIPSSESTPPINNNLQNQENHLKEAYLERNNNFRKDVTTANESTPSSNNAYPNNNEELRKAYYEHENNNKDSSLVNSNPVSSTTEKATLRDEWFKTTNIPMIQVTTSKSESSTNYLNKEKTQMKSYPNYDYNNEKPNDQNFDYPSMTQNNDFDGTYYEPKRIKTLNSNSAKINSYSSTDVSLNKNTESMNNVWSQANEFKEMATQVPTTTFNTVSSFKFTDFIAQESKNDFKPIATTTEAQHSLITTTTESSIESIQNNLFLKSLFKTNIDQSQPNNRFSEKYTEPPQKVLQVKIEAEPKTDKVSKFIAYHPKPVNEIQPLKKKPVDIADILNYVSMKNHYEPTKIKENSKIVNSDNFDHRSTVHFIPIQQNNKQNEDKEKDRFKPLNREEQQEIRGVFKNYKVLQRSNSNINKYGSSNELKRELSPPPLNFSQSLPPLGRAGPSMKSYLPPIFF